MLCTRPWPCVLPTTIPTVVAEERGGMVISYNLALFPAFERVPHRQMSTLMQPIRARHRSPPLPLVPCGINGFADPNALELMAPHPGDSHPAQFPAGKIKLEMQFGSSESKMCSCPLLHDEGQAGRACAPTLSCKHCICFLPGLSGSREVTH